MNLFVDGISFEYKRDILLRDIKTYDEALKRAILMERLDAGNRVEGLTTSNKTKLVSNAVIACEKDSSVNTVKTDSSEKKEQKDFDYETKIQN
jgi:hypothetical protein